jgi:hypothetical protein
LVVAHVDPFHEKAVNRWDYPRVDHAPVLVRIDAVEWHRGKSI